MIALYDMATRLSTYDFFNWLAHVQLLGAKEIVFKTDAWRPGKWLPKESKRRFWNYIHPGPALAKLPCRIGTDGNPVVGSSQLHEFYADVVKLGGSFERFESVLPACNARYTVTIRETFHNKFKNSDRHVWLRFAEQIGARVIEDHSREEIGLYERLALYAGAQMNFGVPNGPMALLYYTPYPYCVVADPDTCAKSFGGHNIKVGDQIPFALPDQRLVWEKPTLDGLMREASVIKGAA